MGTITAVTLSSKGQLVLPKHIRVRRNLRPGMRLQLEETPEGLLLRPAQIFPPSTVKQVFGMAKSKVGKRSLQDMDTAIATEARRRK